jgi:protein TonB
MTGIFKALNVKVNIFNPEWIEMVFAGKNQEYGAYEIRKKSSSRHMYALLIASILFVGGITGPGLIKSILPNGIAKEEDRARELSIVKLKPNEADVIVNAIPPPPPVRKTIKFTPPVIKPDEEVPEEQEDMKLNSELVKETGAIGTVDYKDGTDDMDAEVATSSNITDEPEGGFIIVEQMPEYPGGQAELMKYISKNINYPVVAQETGIQGTVYLKFVIGRDGKVTNVTVLRGFHSACDKEAIRVVESMPAWKPGRQGGREVRVSYTLPIKFALQ